MSLDACLQEAFFGVDLMNTCKYAPLSSHDILHSGSDSDTANQPSSRPSSPALQPPTTTATIPPAPTAGVEGVAKGVGGEGVGCLGLYRLSERKKDFLHRKWTLKNQQIRI